MDNIVEAEKLLAQYEGYKYIPFNDLQGFEKPGWWEVKPHTPRIAKWSDGNTINTDDFTVFHSKSSWKRIKGNPNLKARYIGRNNNSLKYYCSYDWLFRIVGLLEKEDLSEYFYSWEQEGETRSNFLGISVDRINGWSVDINLELDPAFDISKRHLYSELPDREQLFWVLVEAIKYINKAKNGE